MTYAANMLPSFHEGLPDKATMFGSSALNPNAVQELQKALSAGVGSPPLSGGAALQVQSLEATMRVITFQMNNIRFWKMIPKLPAFNTAEEYNLLKDYGSDNGAFTNEGELPQLQDSVFERRVAIVKYLATQREITHPMLLVRPAHGNVVGLEAQNGAIWLLERMERALFRANSAIVPQEFDGLDAQLFADPNFFPSQTVDLRGRQPTEDDIEDAANRIVERYGVPTDLFMTPRTLSELSKQIYPRERFAMPYSDGKLGGAVKEFESSAGNIKFQPDVFLRPGRRNGVLNPPGSASSPFAPSAPTLASVAPAGSGSYFAGGTTYYWFVTALNRFGESAASASTTQAPGAGTYVTVTATSTHATTTGFRLYRATTNDSSKAQLIRELPLAGVYVDDNFLLPGHGRGYMIQGNVNNLSFRMLAPMLKIPLGTIAASIRWIQVMYGTPIVYSPLKNVCFLNIPDTNTVAQA